MKLEILTKNFCFYFDFAQVSIILKLFCQTKQNELQWCMLVQRTRQENVNAADSSGVVALVRTFFFCSFCALVICFDVCQRHLLCIGGGWPPKPTPTPSPALTPGTY